MNGTVTGEDVWVPMSSILGGQQRVRLRLAHVRVCASPRAAASLPPASRRAARTVKRGAGVGAAHPQAAAPLAPLCRRRRPHGRRRCRRRCRRWRPPQAAAPPPRARRRVCVECVCARPLQPRAPPLPLPAVPRPSREFGGIQEALARAGREAYIVLAGGELMNAIVDNHEAPMVLSSIMKQICTERGRRVVQDGMDILGGAGICMGKDNFLGSRRTWRCRWRSPSRAPTS